ncbi:MAG TPA: MlaD family protein [Solirubrobacteraceae bacterium]|jgi:virulence factor Mce-like protein|nr:MlaD family protein [Solirubrobacteraceae bacterium]
MQKRAPTLANILVIALFALSCFGLLLFLWQSFGGPVPLKPKGYRFTADFPRTLALAEQSEVKISGVPVGHVVGLKLDGRNQTQATMEIESRYAPLHAADRVQLRQKTLLGETYVEVTPGSNQAPLLANEAHLASGNVEPLVTLDDILNTFNPKVRESWRVWMQSQAVAFSGQGESLNLSFATLQPFLESANRLLGALQGQSAAVSAVVRNTGRVFDDLTQREHQLERLIADGDAVLTPAAAASAQFADAWRELPGLERSSEVGLRSLNHLAANASPLLTELKPSERELTLLLRTAESFAPHFDALLTSLGPLTSAAKQGLPDFAKSLGLTTPFLEALRPVLHNFDPLLQYTDEYLPTVEAFFGNFAAASQGRVISSNVAVSAKPHYLRAMQHLGTESLAVFSSRIGINRSNAYSHSGAFSSLASGLPVFSGGNCANSAPTIEGPANEYVTEELINELIARKIGNAPGSTGNSVPAPPCTQQKPFEFNGQTSQFPHVTYHK